MGNREQLGNQVTLNEILCAGTPHQESTVGKTRQTADKQQHK